MTNPDLLDRDAGWVIYFDRGTTRVFGLLTAIEETLGLSFEWRETIFAWKTLVARMGESTVHLMVSTTWDDVLDLSRYEVVAFVDAPTAAQERIDIRAIVEKLRRNPKLCWVCFEDEETPAAQHTPVGWVGRPEQARPDEVFEALSFLCGRLALGQATPEDALELVAVTERWAARELKEPVPKQPTPDLPRGELLVVLLAALSHSQPMIAVEMARALADRVMATAGRTARGPMLN